MLNINREERGEKNRIENSSDRLLNTYFLLINVQKRNLIDRGDSISARFEIHSFFVRTSFVRTSG